MFNVHWEVINDEREDFCKSDHACFETLDEAYKWFGYRFTHRDFYCIITDENGHVASIGWMP